MLIHIKFSSKKKNDFKGNAFKENGAVTLKSLGRKNVVGLGHSHGPVNLVIF